MLLRLLERHNYHFYNRLVYYHSLVYSTSIYFFVTQGSKPNWDLLFKADSKGLQTSMLETVTCGLQ